MYPALSRDGTQPRWAGRRRCDTSAVVQAVGIASATTVEVDG